MREKEMESYEYQPSGKSKPSSISHNEKKTNVDAESSPEQNTNSPLPPCNYTIERSLGRGVFGEVFEASGPDGQRVALKRLSKNGAKFSWNLVNREVDVGKRLKGHNGIAQLDNFFETMSNVYLVFEFVDGMDLFSLMEKRDFHPMTEKNVKQLFKQIVDSVSFCHNKRVAHRDLKLDNIILDENGNTKLIDFGLASMDEEGDKGCKNFVGSPEYVAPEIIRRVPYSGFKADVYSLGMVLYCLLFGQFPFIPEQRFEQLANGEDHPVIDWPDRLPRFPTFVSKTAKDLLLKMLEVDPDKRLSIEEVTNHKWFQHENRNQTQNGHQEVNVC